MNVGRIRIDEGLVLRWLQFPHCTIHETKVTPNGTVEFVIEGLEMPETSSYNSIPNICPLYTRYEDGEGHFVTIRNLSEEGS